MSVENCIPKLKEYADKYLSNEEARDIVSTVDSMKGMYKDPVEFQTKVMEYIDSLGINVSKKNKEKLQSVIKEIELFHRIKDPEFNNDTKQALLSLTEGTSSTSQFSGQSVEAQKDLFKKKYLHAPIHYLKSNGLLPAFESGEFDDDIIRAMYDGIPNKSNVAKTVNAIADFYRSVLDNVWADSTNMGTNLGYIKNYVPVAHDAEKITAMGFDEWVKLTIFRLDNRKTFPHLSQADFMGAVEGFNNGKNASDMLSNKWIKELEADFNKFERQFGSSQLSDYSNLLDEELAYDAKSERYVRNAMKSRAYHWKSADAFIEYNKLAGRNTTFQEMMGGYLNKMTRELGAVSALGPTPIETLEATFANARKAGMLVGQNARDIEKSIRDSFDIATGRFYTSMNENALNRAAKLSRTAVGFSQLGLSAVSNLMDAPSTILNYWTRTDENVVWATTKGIMEYIGAAKDVVTKNARSDAYIALSEAILDDYMDYLKSSNGLRGNDKISRAMDLYLSAMGMKVMNRISTLANVKLAVKALEQSNVDGVLAKDLERFGLTKDIVDFARKKILPDMTGNIDGIMVMDDTKFDNNPLGVSGVKFKSELYNRMYAYINDYATSGSPKPGVFERRKLALGQTPGTYLYEGVQALTQYKAINLKQFRNMMLASRLRGGGALNNIKVLATYGAVGTVAAAGVETIRNFIKNGYDIDKTKEQITENPAKLWGKSLARSNAMAFIGEMFIDRNGEVIKDTSELATQVLGPSVIIPGNIALKTGWYGFEKGKELFGKDNNAEKQYKAVVDAFGRGMPLRNSPMRYIPAVNEAIDDAYQSILDFNR